MTQEAFGFVFGPFAVLLGVWLFRADNPPMTGSSAPPKVMGVMFVIVGVGMFLSVLFVDQTP